MDDTALRKQMGQLLASQKTDAEQAHGVLGLYLRERATAPPDEAGGPVPTQQLEAAGAADHQQTGKRIEQLEAAGAAGHQLRSITALKCLDGAAELFAEMVADEKLPLETRIGEATTLLGLSWVTGFSPLGPSEFESLIEKSMDDPASWGALSFLFQRVCENDPLWFQWKSVVRRRLPELAEKVRVPLLRRPKSRHECRLVALASRHAAEVRGAEAAVLAGARWMEEQGYGRTSAPPEVQALLESAPEDLGGAAE